MEYERIQAIRKLSNETTELDSLLWIIDDLVDEWVTDEVELLEYLDKLEENAKENEDFELEMKNDTL